MARLFPLRSEVPIGRQQPRVVDLDGEDADAVFGALSSTTARTIYATLHEEPGTASDVAEAIDSSIQNVRYHLEKLEDAGLIEVVDTWYSSRGNEMSVYAAADGPLIVTTDESLGTQLKEALSRLVGGIGGLAIVSLLVQLVATRSLFPTTSLGSSPEGAADGGDGGGAVRFTGDSGGADEISRHAAYDGSAAENDQNVTANATGYEQADDGGNRVVHIATEHTPTPEEAAAADAIGLPPGLLFFAGGLLVLLLVLAWWYWPVVRER